MPDKRLILALMVWALAVPGGAASHAQERDVVLDSLWIDDTGTLFVGFHVDRFFDDRVIQGIERGFTVGITCRVDLWRERNNWVDQPVSRRMFHYKVGFRKFDQRYVWIDEETSERLATPSLTKVEQRCSAHPATALVDTSQLREGRRYYVQILCILEPLSVESMEEIRAWLGGEADELNLAGNPQGSPKKITGSILKLFKNLAGFGNQHFIGRGRNFTVTRDKAVRYVPD